MSLERNTKRGETGSGVRGVGRGGQEVGGRRGDARGGSGVKDRRKWGGRWNDGEEGLGGG